MKTITITASVVLFLSSFQLSNADVLKTYIVEKNNDPESKALIYREPTVHSAVLHRLPAGSKGIVALSKPRKYGKRQWQNVVWKGQHGWMMFKYLKYDPDTSKKVNEQSCHVSNIKTCL